MMLTIWLCCTEAGSTDSTDLTTLKNNIINGESTPQTPPRHSADKTKANFDDKNEPITFTNKMVSGKTVYYKENYK